MRNLKLGFNLIASGVVIALALLFCMYPAAIVGVLLTDVRLNREGQSCLVPMWFSSVAGRYQSWAIGYLESGYARSVDLTNVAATEWPMFGSVFFLVTAEELQKQGKIDARAGKIRKALETAAAVVVSPGTATWVNAKWGKDYLKKENVFYRMLVILGLSSYERTTGDTRYRALMAEQRAGLADELMAAKYHVLDDYPGECWPNDVVWSVASIQRAAALEGTNHNALARALMTSLDGVLKVDGLPAFKVDKDSGRVYETPRGCGNSGILPFAAELDADIAARWYREYDARFWKQTTWLAGFTELPRGSSEHYSDVDSGPVVCEFGSVASAFGIGAAKACGRMDRAVPLTLEAVACSWPTPFGFLLPAAMGKIAVGGGCLAETALLFSMTRPTCAAKTVPFSGPVPLIVWVMLGAYACVGALLIGIEVRAWRRFLGRRTECAEAPSANVFNAPWGRTLKSVSFAATAILLGVAVIPSPGLGWPVRLLPIVLLVGALPFVVRGYEIREGALLVRRLCWNTRIELKGLQLVQFEPEVLKGSMKTCGNGGLYSFTGWFWSRRLRTYSMYVTDLTRPVVLTFTDRRIVVSPDQPEAFVRALSVFCGC